MNALTTQALYHEAAGITGVVGEAACQPVVAGEDNIGSSSRRANSIFESPDYISKSYFTDIFLFV